MTQDDASSTLALELGGPAATREDWERATAAVLRKTRRLREDDPDSSVWERLTRTTLDGIQVPPVGSRETTPDIADSVRPGRAGAWDVRVIAERGATSEQVRAELENGATSVWVRADATTDVGALLEGVFVDLAPVVLDAPHDPVGVARSFLGGLDTPARSSRALDHRGDDRALDGRGDGGGGLDTPARSSRALDHRGDDRALDHRGDDRALDHRGDGGSDDRGDDRPLHPDTNLGGGAGSIVELAAMAGPAGIRAGVVDATEAHDAGASDAQELGYALALGATYLRLLTEAGHSVAEAADLFEFRFAATDEQFPTIAKLRAARRTWHRVLELSGVTDLAPQRQHVVTSRPMLSKYDPYVNMLRTTVAAFAAGVGGADAVTVLPFDSPLGLPDAFGRRIARNQSSLLISEAHVAEVADPAGGAYAVERLTDDLAAAAWTQFQQIEAEGGAGAAGLAGLPRFAARIADVVAAREAQIEDRSRPLTGLTEFPNLAEQLPARPARTGRAEEVRRYGAAFEALRDQPADQPVFLATMGPVAAHTARATFATNLLAAGGIRVELAGATATVDDVLSTYDGQAVVCLAGADPAYAEWGAALVDALRTAGARHVILAGRPESLGGTEVDDACALGLNAYEFLTRTREALR